MPRNKGGARRFGPDRAVFLDRDGVINQSPVIDGKPYAPRSLATFRLLPGVIQAISALKRAGFRVIVVTNQPDIGNGLVDAAVVDAMNQRILSRTEVDEIKMCPHSQDAGCDCRKPGISLVLEAARKWRLNLSECYFVGDRNSDIVSGQRAGCYTVFVDRGYAENGNEEPDFRAPNLPRSAEIILRHFARIEA